jgi:hypothetical protein
VDRVHKTISWGFSFQASKLLGVDNVFNIGYHPPDHESSRTLARQGVSEMGLVSPSQVGGCDFGTGMMSESFHIVGTIPDESDVSKIVATGSAKS